MTFAEKLRELRDAAGLSEAKLADASGVSFASVHEYGLGRRKPSFESVVKIARALGATCEAFAGCVDVGGQPADAFAEVEADGQAEVKKKGRKAAAKTDDQGATRKKGRRTDAH